MAKILFLNCLKAQCSIWNSGLMVYHALKQSPNYQIDYFEVDRTKFVIPADYDVFVFNYHPATMGWLDTQCLQRLNGIKLVVVLEMYPNDPYPSCPRDVFDGYLVLDPTMRHEDKNVFAFPRPLEMFQPQKTYANPPVPVIGTFGFATPGKGFEKVVDAVNKEFGAAIVRINIPHGTYVPQSESYAKELAEACVARAKKGVDVRVTHEYMTKQQLVDWCAENTLNCFLYDRSLPGLAATTDQAILSMRPLAVSPNDSFRHITQYLRPYPDWSLRDSISNSVECVVNMKSEWSPAKFAERFEQVLALYPVSEAAHSGQKQFKLIRRGKVRLIIGGLVGLGKSTIKRCADFKNSCMRKLVLRWLHYRRIVVHNYPSYSQAGEDLIVGALFRSFGGAKFSYLDVGANHPDFISNTYLFYKQGHRGVCVEPNPVLYSMHRRKRPEDVCLNVGVSIDDRKEADFYLFDGIADGLSTFSKCDADHWMNVGMDGIGKFKLSKVVKTPLMSINEIILESGTPDFLSIDVEGLDLSVLQTLDLKKFQIKCICVETLRYGPNKEEFRDTELMQFMKRRGYIAYADTGINTIYVNERWFCTCQQRLETPQKVGNE